MLPLPPTALSLLLLCYGAHAVSAVLIAWPSTESLQGNLGDRATTSAFCLARGQDLFGCAAASSYLFYYNNPNSTEGMPLDETVYDRTGRVLGQNLTENLDFSGFPSFWIGGVGAYDNCDQFEIKGCFNGMVRLSDGNVEPMPCAAAYSLVCVCAGGSFDATPNPTTIAPTSKAPSKSPTGRPTLRPTRNPTLNPTKTPTAQPTLQPTSQPTTQQPTRNPSAVPPGIILYTDDVLRTGAIGNRSTTTAMCAATASAQSLTCSQTLSILDYASDNIFDLATTYSFSSAFSVYSKTGVYVGTWTNFKQGGPVSASLSGAGVTSNLWWTGDGGAFSQNCRGSYESFDGAGWTSAAVDGYGYKGDPTETDTIMDSLTTQPCDTTAVMVCACVGTAIPDPPTATPTSAPTRAPTSQPTLQPTSAPTVPGIVLYSENVAVNGNLGNRATTTAYCAALATTQSRTCSQTVMLISYGPADVINDMTSVYGFSGALPVRGPTGTLIASSFTTFVNGVWSTSLFTGGVITATYDWWNGGVGAEENCLDWTDGSFANNAFVGTQSSSTAGLAFNNNGLPCEDLAIRVCMCLP